MQLMLLLHLGNGATLYICMYIDFIVITSRFSHGHWRVDLHLTGSSSCIVAPSTTEPSGGRAEYVSKLGMACNALCIMIYLSIDIMPSFLAANFAPSLVNVSFAWRESVGVP